MLIFLALTLAPGGETWRAYLQRSSTCIAKITARHDNERVLILGHGETIDAAFHYFFDLPATSRATVALAAHHASLTTWAKQPISWIRPTTGQRWTLMSHNDTRHLAVEPEAPSAICAGTCQPTRGLGLLGI